MKKSDDQNSATRKINIPRTSATLPGGVAHGELVGAGSKGTGFYTEKKYNTLNPGYTDISAVPSFVPKSTIYQLVHDGS